MKTVSLFLIVVLLAVEIGANFKPENPKPFTADGELYYNL